ncbi:hypothetical protein ACFOY8_14500 [Thalassospira xianhensis]|uniref:Uncharacterized protein n=1 Tax=Thalassospira xianhensis MCCC 1A02616 TaxID=1177929 RepID=A0A367UH57_9PROT|nr:hypothetical protein [Thalassospira xianhensis]RCK07637.1 hypothetical protein TH5_00745 [Thalassospira xianhensis MCCC 1A02616]
MAVSKNPDLRWSQKAINGLCWLILACAALSHDVFAVEIIVKADEQKPNGGGVVWDNGFNHNPDMLLCYVHPGYDADDAQCFIGNALENAIPKPMAYFEKSTAKVGVCQNQSSCLFSGLPIPSDRGTIVIIDKDFDQSDGMLEEKLDGDSECRINKDGSISCAWPYHGEGATFVVVDRAFVEELNKNGLLKHFANNLDALAEGHKRAIRASLMETFAARRMDDAKEFLGNFRDKMRQIRVEREAAEAEERLEQWLEGMEEPVSRVYEELTGHPWYTCRKQRAATIKALELSVRMTQISDFLRPDLMNVFLQATAPTRFFALSRLTKPQIAEVVAMAENGYTLFISAAGDGTREIEVRTPRGDFDKRVMTQGLLQACDWR